jgi:quercetin dioxygenase-like cupin family protein
MPDEFFAVDTALQPWEERFNEKLGKAIFRKDLYADPETGAEIRLVRYPAGLVNPHHTHPCGHGLYVLEGHLVTHKGTFGPGTFVWFPEGEVMEHGATSDADVTVLFITNKWFRIDYVDGPVPDVAEPQVDSRR